MVDVKNIADDNDNHTERAKALNLIRISRKAGCNRGETRRILIREIPKIKDSDIANYNDLYDEEELKRKINKDKNVNKTKEEKDRNNEEEIEYIMSDFFERSLNTFKDSKNINEFKNYERIYGQDDAIKIIKNFQIDRKTQEKEGKPYHKGMILVAPPRQGKDTLIKAMIKEELNESDDVIVQLYHSDVISHNLKESASNVRKIIAALKKIVERTNKSVHVIIDEAERMMPSKESTSANQSILGSTWLSEIGGMSKFSKIYFYLMCNDITKFDKGMIDYGRISIKIVLKRLCKEAIKQSLNEFIVPLCKDVEIDDIVNIIYDENKSLAFIEKGIYVNLDAKKNRGINITNEMVFDEIEKEILREVGSFNSGKNGIDYLDLISTKFKENILNGKGKWEGTPTDFTNVLSKLCGDLLSVNSIGIFLSSESEIEKLKLRGLSILTDKRKKINNKTCRWYIIEKFNMVSN